MPNTQNSRIPKLEPQEILETHKAHVSLDETESTIYETEEYPQCLQDDPDEEQSPRTSRYEISKDNDLVDVDDISPDDQPSYFQQNNVGLVKNPVFREELDGNSILTRNITDESYIDTVDLSRRILDELKQYSIPQTLFAERILARSQGTLSDLLRNPRPWNEMKSGKDTYRRMFNWLQQPLHIRLSILNLYDFNGTLNGDMFSPANTTKRKLFSDTEYENGSEPFPKKARFMFTEKQKSALMAIFNETDRLPKDLMEKVADRLGLAPNCVNNFFMNARRRQKINKPKSSKRSNANITYDEEYLEDFEDEQVDVTELEPSV